MSELTYKKITDVEQVSALNDVTTVFINDGGAMKQVAADKLSAVKTINGVLPDESGDIQIPTVDVVQFMDLSGMGGPIQCNMTAEQVVRNKTGKNKLVVYRRIDLASDVSTDYYTHTYTALGTSAMRIDFNDGKAPIIVDGEANTITLDPDWVAPKTIPEPTAPYQYLTTDAEGNKIWEDKLAYAYQERTIIHEGFTVPEGKNMLYGGIPAIVNPIQEGNEYTVIWDNIPYACKAETKEASLGTSLGNLALLNSAYSDQNTGEPFLFIGFYQHNMVAIIMTADSNGHVCNQVYGANTIYTKINGNYIGGGVFPGDGQNATVIGQGIAKGVNSVAANSAFAHAMESFAENFGTVHPDAVWGHAEGGYTHVYGQMGHAEGYSTLSYGEAQHVQGKSNIEDSKDKYAHIVGNGTSKTGRSNAHTLDWDGNAKFAGDVYVQGTGSEDLVDAKKLATEEYVDSKTTLPSDNGIAGQFAVSDGKGGIMWKTLVEAEEVAY